MIKNNFAQRLILTLIAIPLILIITIYGTWYYNALVCFIVMLASFLGTMELGKMLFCKKLTLLAFFAPLQIAAGYFESFGKISFPLATCTALLLILGVFAKNVFKGGDTNFDNAIEDTSKMTFLIIYPSLMLSSAPFILNKFERGNIWFLFMLFLIFANDSFCYVGGKLFGKNNKGFLKASPNKSIAGFISGYIFTFLVGCVYMFMFKDVFGTLLYSKLWVFAIMSLCVSTLADIGDLTESVLKRSAKIKDSGKGVLGRGGVMDSIDSIIAVTPFFYIGLLLLKSFDIIL